MKGSSAKISPTDMPTHMCPHQHFRTPLIKRNELTRDEYASLLATPKGYRWVKSLPKKYTGPKCFSLIKPVPKKCDDNADLLNTPEKEYIQQFLAQISPLLTPEMLYRLKFLFVKEFGMTAKEAETFIKNENKEKKIERKFKEYCDRDIKALWSKEFERLLTAKITDYILSYMCSKLSKRAGIIAENFLTHLGDITEERSGLGDPKNSVQRTQVLIAKHFAVWLTDLVSEGDKKLCDAIKIEEERKREEEKLKKLEKEKEIAERKRKEEEEIRRREEEEKKKKEEEEQKKKEEEQRKKEEEQRKKEEEEQKRKEEEERKKREEEEQKKKDEEKKIREEEERMKEEERKRKEEEEQKRKEEEERKKREEEEQKQREEEEKWRREMMEEMGEEESEILFLDESYLVPSWEFENEEDITEDEKFSDIDGNIEDGYEDGLGSDTDWNDVSERSKIGREKTKSELSRSKGKDDFLSEDEKSYGTNTEYSSLYSRITLGDRKSGTSTRKNKKHWNIETYYVKRYDEKCDYGVKKIDYNEACRVVKLAKKKKERKTKEKSKSICNRPKDQLPLKSAKEMKEWAKWATDVVDFAEEWYEWIVNTTEEAKEAKVEIEEDKKLKNTTKIRIKELKRNKKCIADTSKVWKKKIEDVKKKP